MTRIFRALFLVALVALISGAFTKHDPRRFDDWDTPLYLSIAYGIKNFGVFSNGKLTTKEGQITSAEPGMFVSPFYPVLLRTLMSIDHRFDTAVACAVKSIHGSGDVEICERYIRPVRQLHVLLLIIGLFCIGLAAVRIAPVSFIFYAASGIATLGVVQLAGFFSQITIEALLFCLFSVTMLAFTKALLADRPLLYLLPGISAGLLTLAKPSYFALVLFLPLAYAAHGWIARRKPIWRNAGVLVVGFLLVVGPWVARNYLNVGRLGLSAEYGSAAVVERFAYNNMTSREWGLSFPYCIPRVGPKIIRALGGSDEMRRFDWQNRAGFFQVGFAERRRLTLKYGGIDPVIWSVVKEEIGVAWLSYVLTTIALAWCGLWIAETWALICFPLFIAGVFAMRRGLAAPVLSYSLPPLLFVGLHAAVMSGASRYNIGLIAPLSIVSGWVLATAIEKMRRQRSTIPRLRSDL